MILSLRIHVIPTVVLIACGGRSGTEPDAGDPSFDAGHPVDAETLDAARLDSADPECTPGERRSVGCERCGLVQETCDPEGSWSRTSDCLAQRACDEGAIERESLPLCGERTRLCTASCEWTEWETTTPSSGTCEPGTNRNAEAPTTCDAGSVAVERCDDSCEWRSICAPPCSLVRTEPWDAVEICIPEGAFVRGAASIPSHAPPVESFMSTYLIDRYPVTNRRYAACVEAGACTVPEGFDAFDEPSQQRRAVVRASREQAMSFCAWDGGRLAVSQAEWEKAAKGPAPRSPSYPWGEEPAGCDDVLFEDCPGYAPRPSSEGLAFDVDSHPEWDSVYGVSMLVTVGDTITRELYDVNFHVDSLGSDDPENTWTTVGVAASRGPRLMAMPHPQNMSSSYSARLGTIRCVRRFGS